MRSIVFEGNTWSVYGELRSTDKVMHRNLCHILREMQRGNPAEGLGRPEQLRYDLSGFWSRRLSQYDRLLYRFDEAAIHIFAIGGHYDTL